VSLSCYSTMPVLSKENTSDIFSTGNEDVTAVSQNRPSGS
jgi:hypothetical protein